MVYYVKVTWNRFTIIFGIDFWVFLEEFNPRRVLKIVNELLEFSSIIRFNLLQLFVCVFRMSFDVYFD